MFYKYKKRGKKGQIPTELIYTIVGVVLLIILFSVGYNYSKGFFGKERDKCYDNIIKNVNYLLSEKKVFDSVQGVDCKTQENHGIFSYDVSQENMPKQCGGRSCICLEKFKDNNFEIIKCKVFRKGVRIISSSQYYENNNNNFGVNPIPVDINTYNIYPFPLVMIGNQVDNKISETITSLYIEKNYIKNSDTTYILITKQTKNMTDRYNKLLKTICYKGDSSCIGMSEGVGFDHYSCFKDENGNCKRYNQCNPGDSNCACPKGNNEFEYSEFTCCNGLDGSHILSCFDYKDKDNCEKDSCNVNKLTDPFNKYKCGWKMNLIDHRYECQQVNK